MSREQEIAYLSDEGHYTDIIDVLGNIPESELSFFEVCQLAMAYNNVDRLQDSIDVLMQVWDIGEQHAVWNYYLGYALVFSGQKQEARARLLRARELDPYVPAEAILHYCICYDENEGQPIENMLPVWVCQLVGGILENGTIVLPEYNVKIEPWVQAIDVRDASTMVTLCFNITLPTGAVLFELCAGLGENVLDAITTALGSFYSGIYSAVYNLCHNNVPCSVEDTTHRMWNVYLGNIVSMGATPVVANDYYYNLFKNTLPNYLCNRSTVYMKIYGAKHGENITPECRVNNAISRTLSDILQPQIATWPSSVFSSHKQFLLFMPENTDAVSRYPYTQQEIDEHVKTAVSLFCDKNIEYSAVHPLLAETLNDANLASELYGFIPELCAEQAFEKVTSPDEIHIYVKGEEHIYTKWQITAYHLIADALEKGFQNNLFPEDAFRECIFCSSTFNVIRNAKEEKNVDLTQTGGVITHYYTFNDNYTAR